MNNRGLIYGAVGAFVGLIALIVIIVIAVKAERIEPGHVGISVSKCSGGGVAKATIPTGYYWRELFCEEVIEFPTTMQTLILDQAGEDESITVTSSEGLNINLDVALNFTLDASKVPDIYTRWRAPVDDISHKFIRQTTREMLQATFAKYTAEQLYSTKKEIARLEVEKDLTTRLGSEGFLVQQFTVNRLTPPDQVVQAINNKVAMIQEAQRSEQEVRKKEAEAAQKVAEAKGQADSNIAVAQGEAESIRLRAEAQAKANDLLSHSLTPQLIEYQKMLKWNGELPKFSGHAVPMINMDK
jgi:regulator of protease activity HflC (stomatin/prohibitin superfamily)